MNREALLQELRERTPKSGAYWEEAKNLVPGGLVSGARTMEPYPIYIDRVDGAYAWDIDGNRYIDCVLSFGVHVLGHGPDAALEAHREQCGRAMSLGAPHRLELEFARRFIDCVPCAELAMLCNTGTEATMLAWRLMRAATKKPKVAKFEGCYHGWHDYAQWSVYPDPAKCGPDDKPNMNPATAGIPEAIRETVMVLPFNDTAIEMIEEHADELAGVAIEPIIGGITMPVKKEFLEKLREVTRRNNVLLLFDEVVTGFRVALGGCQELTGVLPDVATYGKIIGGGTPIGAVGCSKVLADAARKSDDSLSLAGTFSGNPLTLATGAATIRYLQENRHIYDELVAKGEYLRNGFNGWTEAEEHPFRMSGYGSMFQFHNLERQPIRPRDLTLQDQDLMRDLQLLFRYHKVLVPWLHLAFFSDAHSQQDLEEMLRGFKDSVAGAVEMNPRAVEKVAGVG